MPRLPTIRVIGSQDISLTTTFCPVSTAMSSLQSHAAVAVNGGRLSPPLLIAGGQCVATTPPLRFDVEVGLDVALAEESDDRAVGELHDVRGHAAPSILVHERHVLVGEPGHRAGHADAADIGAAADAVDPAAHRHVALDHRSLAPQLDQAPVIGAVFGGEVTLLGKPGTVAALAHRATEQPLGP